MVAPVPFPPKAVLQLLQRKEEMVCRQLERNARSRAFDGTKLVPLADTPPLSFSHHVHFRSMLRLVSSHVFNLTSTDYVTEWDDGLDEIKCEFTLAHEALREQMQCVALAWNSTGSVLAVAYARTDYEDWWRHSAAICTVSNVKTGAGAGARTGHKMDTVNTTSSPFRFHDSPPHISGMSTETSTATRRTGHWSCRCVTRHRVSLTTVAWESAISHFGVTFRPLTEYSLYHAQSCPMTLAYHPQQPSLLAVGLLNGMTGSGQIYLFFFSRRIDHWLFHFTVFPMQVMSPCWTPHKRQAGSLSPPHPSAMTRTLSLYHR